MSEAHPAPVGPCGEPPATGGVHPAGAPVTDEARARQDLVQVARFCWDRDLIAATDGNFSCRVPDGILVTPSGVHKGLIGPEDLIVTDMEGRVVRGDGRPSGEMEMHVLAYDLRPDRGAIVHAHPPKAVAFTIAGSGKLAACVIPEVVTTVGTFPTAPYALPTTGELAESLRDTISRHDAVLMERHGAVCLGRDLLEAYCHLEKLEHAADIILAAEMLGGARELPEEEVRRLIELKEAEGRRVDVCKQCELRRGCQILAGC